MQIQSQPEWNMQRYASVQPGLGFSPFPVSQVAPGKSAAAELQLSGSEVKQNNKPTKPPGDLHEEKREGGHGDASKWMALYKLCGPIAAGIGFGGIFGVPIVFAAGVSVVVSAITAGTGLKIHKGDTPWAQYLQNLSSRVMRFIWPRKDRHTAADKEWDMVPVWGSVCAMAGLVEAGINHAFAHKAKPLSVDQLKLKGGFFGPAYKFQAKCMTLFNDIKSSIEAKLAHNLPKALKLLKNLESRFGNKVQGNAKLGYLAGIGIAGIGGMVQSASAAKIQEHLDAKNVAKKQGHPAGKEQSEKSQAEKSEDGKNKPTEPEKISEKPVKPPENKDDQEKKAEKRRDDEAALPTQAMPSPNGQNKPEEQPPDSGVEQSKLAQPKLAPKSEQAKLEPAKSGQAKKADSKPGSETVSYVVQPQPMQPLMWPQPNSTVPPAPLSKGKRDEAPPMSLKSGNPWPVRTPFTTSYPAWLPTNCAIPYPQMVTTF